METFYDYRNFDYLYPVINPLGINALDAPWNRNKYYPERNGASWWTGKHELDDEGYILTNVFFTEEKRNLELDFDYKLNHDGFRSQHFKKLDTNNVNILYAGCSIGFGEGLPEELTWANLLTEKIKNYHKDKNVEYFNVSYMGASIHLIFKNIMAFIRNYGNPDYLFIQFPDMSRNIRWSEEDNSYVRVNFASGYLNQKMGKTHIVYNTNYCYEDSIMLYVDLISALESYCNAVGIKLIWTTWFYPEINIYKNIKFKYFMEIDTNFEKWRRLEENHSSYYPNINNLPYWQIARDGLHAGTAWTTHISDCFFKELIKKEEGSLW